MREVRRRGGGKRNESLGRCRGRDVTAEVRVRFGLVGW